MMKTTYMDGWGNWYDVKRNTDKTFHVLVYRNHELTAVLGKKKHGGLARSEAEALIVEDVEKRFPETHSNFNWW